LDPTVVEVSHQPQEALDDQTGNTVYIFARFDVALLYLMGTLARVFFHL